MKAYVLDLVKCHQMYLQIIRQKFRGNAAFEQALDKAFRAVINDAKVDASLVLARASDSLMKKGVYVS